MEEQTEKELPCRLCANRNDKMIGIYSEEGVANDLANKMNLYLPIKVAESDELPLQCCWSCASTVLAWHELVVASVETDKRLRTALPEEKFQREIVLDVSKEEVETDDDNDVGRELQQATAASLSAYKQTAQPKSPSPTIRKKQQRSKATILCEKSEEEIAIDGYVHELLEEEVEIPCKQEVKFEEDKEWMVKDEEEEGCFSFEAEIIDEVKEEGAKKSVATQKHSKKERKRQTKIDQEKVNAAKVVVDGRVYYNCKICGKSLHSPYTYIWHMRIHTGERPFVCDLCGKQFRVSQGLVRHLKETHEGIKNFECDICGRMFATRRNVVEHRRIHTNERPYICDLCGKAFKQKASLFVHNRSHTDSFPFKCSYCSQGFRTKPPLMIHITRHTGEKPYPCDVCGRCFRIKYELKRHRLIHSDEKPFVCTECGLSFRQKRYLRNHNRINHVCVN